VESLVHSISCGCRALISSRDPRATLWVKIRGSAEWPLHGPVPVVDASGRPFLRGCFRDLDGAQLHSLVQWLARERDGKPEEVVSSINEHGFIPILDMDCHVAFCRAHSSVAMAAVL
jgi:hypothetical protein